MTKNALSVALSQEELLVVMAYLKVRELLGMDPKLLQPLDEKQVQLVIGVAERALIARGLLSRSPANKMELASVIQALVGVCVFPEASLIVIHQVSGGPREEFYFHRSRKMTVLHAMPVSTIHQFIAVEEKGEFIKSILSILKPNSVPAFTGKEGKIAESALAAAKKAAAGGEAGEVVRALKDAEFDSATAEEFASVLVSPTANTTFAFVRGTNSQERGEGFSILQGKKSQWLLAPVNKDDPAVVFSVRPVSADMITGQIKDVIGKMG